MDLSLIVGIGVGFAALLLGFSMEHGVLLSLVLVSPLIIVVGGTFGATIASYSFKDLLQAVRALGSTFKSPQTTSAEKIIQRISELATEFRKEGIKGLEAYLDKTEFKTDEMLLLKEGAVLIEYMKSPEEIQYILESEVRSYTQRKQIEINIWEAAGGYSPTMGVIGTVMGLILVLASGFGEPNELARSISTAFVATFYGVSFANLIYLPIASKLKTALRRSKLQREMIIDGICMIARGDPARNVENALSLYYQAYADGGKKFKAGIEN